jgi:hypothetical protein
MSAINRDRPLSFWLRPTVSPQGRLCRLHRRSSNIAIRGGFGGQSARISSKAAQRAGRTTQKR